MCCWASSSRRSRDATCSSIVASSLIFAVALSESAALDSTVADRLGTAERRAKQNVETRSGSGLR